MILQEEPNKAVRTKSVTWYISFLKFTLIHQRWRPTLHKFTRKLKGEEITLLGRERKLLEELETKIREKIKKDKFSEDPEEINLIVRGVMNWEKKNG